MQGSTTAVALSVFFKMGRGAEAAAGAGAGGTKGIVSPSPSAPDEEEDDNKTAPLSSSMVKAVPTARNPHTWTWLLREFFFPLLFIALSLRTRPRRRPRPL